jgi:hypothetical protein
VSKRTVLLLIIVFGLAACSDNPPEIMQISWQVMLFNDRESGFSYQKLSLFVNIQDEDGIKDIGALYLINDTKEMFWSLDESNWEMTQKGNATWIGSNALTMPSSEHFPTGKYRVYLEDLSGQSDETFIYISNDNINTEQITFPAAYLEGERIMAAFPVDKNGIKTEVITSRDSTLNNSFIYYTYTVHKNKAFGILNGPYYFRTSLPESE